MADREKPTAGRDEIMTRSKTSKAAEKSEEGSRDATEKPEFVCTIKEIGKMEERERRMAEVLKEMETNLAKDPLSKDDANEASEILTETANKKIQPPYFEVEDIPREEMLKKIHTFMDRRVNSDIKMVIEVPTRHNNMIFSHELKRWVLGMGTFKQNYSDNADKQEIHGKRRASIICLSLIRHALESNRHLSLREIFYLRLDVFKNSTRVTTVVNSLCCLFKCTRSSLHIVAAENGLVIGHVQYKQGGITINCLAKGETGRLIARRMDLITEMKDIGAQFILVVEKETVFQRLVEENFHIKVPCIIVTGRGQPGVSTRLFIHRMRYELGLPTFALMDCDAFGIRIFSTYKYGSKTLSFDSGRLTVPDIKLLGLLPSQIDTCGIPEDAKLRMGEKEIQNIEQLLKEEYVKINPRLEYELQKMLESEKKIELEALCFSEPLAYKTDVFVKEMIADKQWVD